MVSANFLSQKIIGKKNIFSNFWFQEMSVKGRFLSISWLKNLLQNMALFQHIL